MSLLDKASLIVTPNAYKASKLYSVVPSSGAGDMDVVRATTATRVNSAGIIESVATNVPRIDYTNGSCPSLLVEPQRTNLITYSEDVTNTDWFVTSLGTGTNPVITSNYTSSPTGTNNADRVQFQNVGGSGSSLNFSLLGKFPLALSSTGTATVYLKSLTASNQNVLCYWGVGQGQVFVVTPQWQRFTLSNLSVSDAANFFIGTRGGSGNFFNGGDEVLDIAIWGAQLEAGAYSTSYVPTLATAVTRNADVISKTGISSLIGQTEGTLFTEIKLESVNSQSIYAVLSSGSFSNSILIGKEAGVTPNKLLLYINASGTNILNNTSISLTTNYIKCAIAYKSGNWAAYVNGSLIASGTSTFSFSSSLDRFGFANNGDLSVNIEKMEVKSAQLYKTRLTNTELAQLTTL